MNDIKPPLCEQISDMVDGLLLGEERSLAVESLMASPQAIDVWHQYHVVGDVLRSAELAPVGDDQAFWERLSARIELEPARPKTIVGSIVDSTPMVVETRPPGLELVSANASVLRWKRVAGLSSVAFVAVVGAGIWSQRGAQESQQMSAATPTTPVLATVEGRNGVMLRDPQLDQLMADHRQMGGHSALQLPAGFLRSATYEGPGQ